MKKEEYSITSEKGLDISRRKLMILGSATIAAPFVMKMTSALHGAEAAEKEADKQYTYTIGPGCLGCNYCFNECPGKAIQWGDDTYVIDQKKCLHCGTCYRVCNAGIVVRK